MREQTIDEAAAEWAVRLDRGLDESERLALDHWLGEDRLRRGALARAQAVFSQTAEGLGSEFGEKRPSRRLVIGGGLGLVAAVGAGALITPRMLGRQTLMTRIGEIRRVPLEDGSFAAINTDTVVAVALKPERREIALERGEAWFQVAKDKERPFIVAAGPVRVRAVGTAFSVRRRSRGAQVMVTEGVVEVWSKGASQRRRVVAGEQAFVSDKSGATAPIQRPLEVGRALAWREGQIILDGDTVGAAVADFNRYNARKIIIADPRVEGRRVVGWFRTNEPESFASAVARSEGVPIDATDDLIILGAGG